MYWTIKRTVVSRYPRFVVAEGDVVRMTITNSNADHHPMHLQGTTPSSSPGTGVPASGRPWWTDSLEVARGETYEIAFMADNLGIWMDHCHNLPHAADGLVAHLAFTGAYTPYRIGGPAGNEPE